MPMPRHTPLTADQRAKIALKEAYKDRESVLRHKPKVTGLEKDGAFVDVEYTTGAGERVWAIYERVGWRRAPREEEEKMFRAMTSPPISMSQG
jgi:hypothetical protein